ncbi:uncharacterized protein LOC136074898 [Hydra vulgaris]|uniref:Uncharacterized protein LOC136074898 n=1 Tax=Hydra vulgaris TaxID=6087 RepID=A0ABM4B2Z5_HYDVU
MNVNKSVYPSLEDMGDIEYGLKWVPKSLQLFQSYLISVKLRQISLGQCIAQASRPRSMIAPIPYGIGVDIDKSFGTKWLVDHLYKFGFSISTDEFKLFKLSAAVSRVNAAQKQEPNFLHWVADNVDHNIRTLTGKGTFHEMGSISICLSSKCNYESITRLKHKPIKNLSDLSLNITPYHGSSYQGLLNVSFKPIKDIVSEVFRAPEMNLDLI